MSTLQVTQARAMKSEWTKLRTQPGALWSLLSAVILVVTFGILYSLLRVARPPHGAAAASFDPTSVSLAGVQLAQIAARVLGVLLITSEYATGLIRTTLAAVPRRLPHAAGQGGGGDRRGGRGERPGRGRGVPGRAGDPGPPAPVGVVR